MKFISLKLNNFRQYIGEHYLEFAGRNGSSNVTLIFGGNGFGKTGIFRAIMFCLYGDRYLEQDSLTEAQKKEGLILVNERLLEEPRGRKVTATVELKFEHKGNLYILKREISGLKDKKILQEPGQVSLQITEDTNTKPPIYGDDEVKNEISKILHRSIRDFFLFDGERMEKLTRYNDTSRNEVKKGIKNLLHLDALEIAQKGLDKTIQDFNKKITANSSGELEIVSERLSKCGSKLVEINENIRNLTEENTRIDTIERQIEEKLGQQKEAIEKHKKMEYIKKQIAQIKSEQEASKNELRELLEESGAYLALPIIVQLHSELDVKIEKGELPSGVREDFIDKLIKDCKCICGTEIDDNSEAKMNLLYYKQHKTSLISNVAMKIYNLATKLKYRTENMQNKFQSAVNKHLLIKERYEDALKELDELLEELGEIKETQDLADNLKKLKIQRKENDNKLGALNNELVRLEKEEKELKYKQEVLSEKNKKVQRYIQQRTIVEKAQEEFDRIYDDYSTRIRKNLSEVATNIFKQLADPDTLKSLSKIVISDNFQLDILSHSGGRMLSQISSGQRQVVSLAYICALLQLGSNLEMPLLMDTPFGRLSGAPRDACLKELPKIIPQWILLGTDTEIRQEEASALRKSEHWGKIYEIEPIEDRKSKIVEKDINSWVPYRRTK